jgi:serine/threonine protein phosphatase PrpC
LSETQPWSDGVVLPLEQVSADTVDVDPWRLLAEEQGLLVSWSEAPRIDDARWGPALRGASALGEQLASIVNQAGQARLVSAGATLFRLELPTGSTLQNLVPAVGGGFRGLVRTAESTSFAGQVRLVPVAGGVAAGVALGPLVGLMALSVGAEMLARHQQDKKLDAIHRGVEALNKAADETTRAQLDSAEQALELGSAAILDWIDVPSSIGLGSARDNLRVIKNRGLQWLAEWEQRADTVKRGSTGISYGDMRDVLGGKDSGDAYTAFPNRVETIYRAVALDSRAVVLTGAEAALRREDQTLGHLQEQLRRELQRNAAVQDRLRQLLWDLTTDPVTFGLPAMPDTGKKVARLHRTLSGLAIAVSRVPDAPAMLNSGNRQVTEILREANGSLRVLAAPAAERSGV